MNIAAPFRVMSHSRLDLSDIGDWMSPAQIAMRMYSGAENMPSYRGNLKPEELESLLAFLAFQHREQLHKAARTSGVARPGPANGR